MVAPIVIAGAKKGAEIGSKVLENETVTKSISILNVFNPIDLFNWVIFFVVFFPIFIILLITKPFFVRQNKIGNVEPPLSFGRLILFTFLFTIIPYVIISYVVSKGRIAATRGILKLVK